MSRERFPRDGLYKALGPSLTSCHGGAGRWKIGVRRSVRGELVACENGIHLCRDRDIAQWLHTSLWLVRASKEQIVAEDKVVARWAVLVRRTPLNDRLLRLLAADYAEHIAHHNTDPRVGAAILAGRRYAFGLIDAAARAAAGAAAWDAAGAAAWDAAGAWAAAGAAAWAAARAAARDAAGAAARAAAGDAAGAAAWAAAGAAARDAAWAAAGAAARDAAGVAAWDAEREWQTARLFDYLNGRVNLKAIRASISTTKAGR